MPSRIGEGVGKHGGDKSAKPKNVPDKVNQNLNKCFKTDLRSDGLSLEVALGRLSSMEEGIDSFDYRSHKNRLPI